MTVLDLTLAQAREKAADRQDKLKEIFEQAKSGDSYDFNKVTVLGADVKGSIAVAEKVNQMSAELNEICAHAETLEAAEKAAAELENRGKARRNFVLPGGGGGGKGDQGARRIKSLGQLVAEEKSYQAWASKGAAGTLQFNYEDVWLSDILAAGSAYDTMGSKALMTTSAGYAPESTRLPGFVEMATRPIQMLDIIPVFQTGFDTIKYMEETTRTHGAAETAEGGTYAESAFVFTEKNSPVEKITDSVPVTDEQLEDVPMMSGYINGRLTFGIRQRFDGQTLVGNGTSPNLRGLKNTAGIQTQAKGTDPVPDAFFKAMTKIRTNGRTVPTHHVIHPTDWQNIRLLRTADGVYIWGPPSEAGPERLWGLQVVQCDADQPGTGYTGSFLPAWCSIFERQGVDIQIGFVGTQFAEGKRTVRGSARAALVFQRPAAFSSVTGL